MEDLYDRVLFGVSITIAVIASSPALDLASRVVATFRVSSGYCAGAPAARLGPLTLSQGEL